MKANLNHALNRIWGIILFIWGILILLVASRFPRLDDHHPGPALFPAIVGVGFLLTGILLYLTPHPLGSSSTPAEKVRWYRGAIVLVLCLIMPWLTSLVGFFVPLSAVVVVVAYLAGLNWWRSLLTGGITGAVIFYLFTQLLRVPL